MVLMRSGFIYACCLLYLMATGNSVFAQSAAIENPPVFTTEERSASAPENYRLILNDSSHLFVIKDIEITGNKYTRPGTILREVSFNINDSYPLSVIVDKFYEARKQIMNSGLFRNVVVSLKSLRGYDVYVHIEVEEKWYIYPIPFMHPVDKSFHQWWTKDRSIDRVNYGVRLEHHNFTGRNDKLNLRYTNGFTKEIALQYYGLYLDSKMQWSLNGGVGWGHLRQLNYITDDNKQLSIQNTDHYL